MELREYCATPPEGNELCKCADHTYVIVPAANEHSRCSELDHIQHWAKTNNLVLNRHKSKEIIVTLSRCSKRSTKYQPTVVFAWHWTLFFNIFCLSM